MRAFQKIPCAATPQVGFNPGRSLHAAAAVPSRMASWQRRTVETPEGRAVSTISPRPGWSPLRDVHVIAYRVRRTEDEVQIRMYTRAKAHDL